MGSRLGAAGPRAQAIKAVGGWIRTTIKIGTRCRNRRTSGNEKIVQQVNRICDIGSTIVIAIGRIGAGGRRASGNKQACKQEDGIRYIAATVIVDVATNELRVNRRRRGVVFQRYQVKGQNLEDVISVTADFPRLTDHRSDLTVIVNTDGVGPEEIGALPDYSGSISTQVRVQVAGEEAIGVVVAWRILNVRCIEE